MVKKPQLIPLGLIKPTEPYIPQDCWDEITTHYNGTPASLTPKHKPVIVYRVDRYYLIDEGNKRAAYLSMQGHAHVPAIIQDHEPGEEEDLKVLADKVEKAGVKSLDDLAHRVYPREIYEKLMDTYQRE